MRTYMCEEDPTLLPIEMNDQIMRHVVSCPACWQWLDKINEAAVRRHGELTQQDKDVCDQIAHRLAKRIISESN